MHPIVKDFCEKYIVEEMSVKLALEMFYHFVHGFTVEHHKMMYEKI